MLAWIHQAIASEKELFYNLYRFKLISEEKNDVLNIQMFNKVFSGIIRPLKIRIQQGIIII